MNPEKQLYRTYHLRFWTSFWIHMRPYLLFVSGVAGFAGIALGAQSSPCGTGCFVGMVAFFFAYGFGQALTDCFQTDTDKLSAPYRPLSQGIVSPKEVGIIAFSGLILLGIVIVWLNINNLIFCILSIAGLATYTYVKKHVWWGGPFYNAWIVALLPIMGFLVATGSGIGGLWASHLLALMLLTFFSYANFVLMGYLKDITADKETGYKTFPVVFGWDATTWVGDVFVVLSSGLTLVLVAESYLALGIASLGILIAVAGQLYAHLTKQKNEKNATFPISATVRSFILWHLAVGVAFQPQWIGFAGVFYLLFEVVLKFRPMREQI